LARISRNDGRKSLKLARRGDIRTLVRIESPDDAEFADPLSPGDPDSLVRIDNPDDAESHSGATEDNEGIRDRKTKRAPNR
jgi:hypothetical protein